MFGERHSKHPSLAPDLLRDEKTSDRNACRPVEGKRLGTEQPSVVSPGWPGRQNGPVTGKHRDGYPDVRTPSQSIK